MHRRSAVADEASLWARLPAALFRVTPAGLLRQVNPAFVACLHGASPESLLGTPARDLHVDLADRTRWDTLVRAQGVGPAFETQLRRQDGTTFCARETVRAVRDPTGEVVLFEGLIEDVDAATCFEQRLQASELRYRRLFETAQDGILILDAEAAAIVDVNPFLCALLGLSREEILGRKLWEIGPFKDIPASRANFRELQTMEHIRYEDLPLETARGDSITVEFVSNVYRAGGKTVIQCNVRDITERVHATAARAVLSHAVEQAGESIVITDSRGAIVYVNPAFERVSGWPSAEALGKNPNILKSGKQGDAFYRGMWQTLARGEVWTGLIVNRRKDGTLFEEDATISPVRDAVGLVVNYVAVKRDVTKETRLERQLLQSQKMEAVGRLAGGVAHDFNNLIGVIKGYGELVHSRLGSEHPLREKMEHLLKAADRAAGLTRQLLAFGRRQVLLPTVLEVGAVVLEMEKMLRRLIGEDLELVTRLAPDVGRVRADAGQIEQVLMNLAVNARDAMPDGGRITIEARNVDLDADYAAAHVPVRPGPYVMLAMSDTGSGMNAATQARIFEPFFSTKGVGKGTGLGLSTVYGIIKQSGGYVWVTSEVGLGTTFEIYFPRVDELAVPAQPEAQRLSMRGDETILLVEDEESLRELLREALEDNGYSVLVARDGAEALQIAEAQDGPTPLLLCDVVMPGMTGPQIVDLIARMKPDLKVLFISGHSEEAVARHGLTGPGRAFLGKPFGLDTMLRCVRELLDRR